MTDDVEGLVTSISMNQVLVAILEEQLQHALATKVRISKKKKRGNINIEFYSQEDLERVVNVIKGGR